MNKLRPPDFPGRNLPDASAAAFRKESAPESAFRKIAYICRHNITRVRLRSRRSDSGFHTGCNEKGAPPAPFMIYYRNSK